ncbi:phasin family protein [Shimia biformata]|uniref:phasin family protein n=1 Tax=Shimia biformata TaxID=1294299 RepID=UPI00194ED1EF|nr:phasin family protein [Shimia biformata]
MTKKTAKPESASSPADAAKNGVDKVNAWAKDAGEQLREAAARATTDFKTAGNIAIEGEVQHSTRLLQLAGDLLNARSKATLSILEQGELKAAADIERDFLKSAAETLTQGIRELNEIRVNTLRDASETYSTRAKEAIDRLSKPGAAA